MEKKKPTNAQLQKRLEKAVVHIDRTKNTREIYFDDKGLRLIDCDDCVIVGTNFHQHVFYKVTANGYSRPCLYVSRFIDIALVNNCVVKDENGIASRSYAALFKALGEKEDKNEYYIARYVDGYLFNIFCPLYQIDDNEASNFRVYFEYLHNIACNNIYLSEHKEGLSNKQYWEDYKKSIEEFMANVDETNIFDAVSDEDLMKMESDAMKEESIEQNGLDAKEE